MYSCALRVVCATDDDDVERDSRRREEGPCFHWRKTAVEMIVFFWHRGKKRC